MASVEKYHLANGEPRYNVHWRAGSRSLERTFRRAKHAKAFGRRVEAEQTNGGTVNPARGDMAFGVYAETWLAEHAGNERAPERPFVDTQIVRALADAIEARYRALVLLAGFGGLRLGELIALRRHDVDLGAGTVRVERQTVELAHGQRLERPHPRPTPAYKVRQG